MISVRPIQFSDVPLILDYWYVQCNEDHLRAMGADPSKLPKRIEFEKALNTQIELPYKDKKAYCIIWLDEKQQPVGHCNINKIEYGNKASMHLHLWPSEMRKTGLGQQYVKMSIPYFFEKMKLKSLYSEPFAHNAAPNKTLPKVGFTLVKKYLTTPGAINFEQEVNHWTFDADQNALSLNTTV